MTNPEAAMARERALEEALWQRMETAPRNHGAMVFIKVDGSNEINAFRFSAGSSIYPYKTWEPLAERDRQGAILAGDEKWCRWAPFDPMEIGRRALATIAALEKRIGELEAERDEALREHTDMMWQRRRAEEKADAERQRREACEAALRPYADATAGLFDNRAAREYFSRYPSESDNRFRVGEDHSYYGGPDYKCVTAEQCSELEKRFAEAERDIADNPPKVAG